MVEESKIKMGKRGKSKGVISESMKSLQSALLREMELQCDLALTSYEELEESMEEFENDKLWHSIHAFLDTTSKISELVALCEKAINDQGSGEVLRRVVDNSKESKLSDPALKRFSISYRDRLEEWAKQTEKVVEKNVIEKGCISGIDEKDMLRHFDPETYDLTIRGQSYNLKSYYQEISKIKDKIDDVAEECFWRI